MHVLHYVVGVLHYVLAVAAVLAEAPGFVLDGERTSLDVRADDVFSGFELTE